MHESNDYLAPRLILAIAPKFPHVTSGNTAISVNVLQSSLEQLQPSNPDTTDTSLKTVLFSSTADKRLNLLVPASTNLNRDGIHLDSWQVSDSINADSPVLSYVLLQNRFIVFTTISGSIVVYDGVNRETICKRKDHFKYGVHIIQHPASSSASNTKFLLVTAGWDSKIHLYTIDLADEQSISLDPPCSSISLESLPESILFKIDQYDSSLYLISSRRDSTFLSYYRIDTTNTPQPSLVLAGKQNLAPYANSWNAFTPSCLASCPSRPDLLAVATSSVPYMKCLGVRILFPRAGLDGEVPAVQSAVQEDPPQHASSSSPAGAAAAEAAGLQLREDAAVLFHCNTLVGQTQYSLPVVTWRPDGSGVWVASEEGVIKGIDMAGKVVCVLTGGHDAGVKVRCLWAGSVPEGGPHGTKDREYLVSGGFDGRIIVWSIDDIIMQNS